MLGQLKEQGFPPESMLADTAFGSDENVELAAAMGVELVSPVSGSTGEGKTAEATSAGPAGDVGDAGDGAVVDR